MEVVTPRHAKDVLGQADLRQYSLAGMLMMHLEPH
jgi:hypothetical protein